MSVIVSMNVHDFLRWSDQEPERAEEMKRLFNQEGSQLVMAEMRQHVPIRTGFLRESITSLPTPEGFTVYPTAPYAYIVDKGSKPHEILPRFAKALAFEWKGAMRFFKRVQHPGFPGRGFVERTRMIAKAKLFDLACRIWRELHERYL